jgi:hypothetical protein
VPRQFSGKGRHRRLGSEISRWRASPEQQEATWYAHTATEILVLGAAGDPINYAIAAARLCDHTIAWDARTRYPVPLHAAHQMDRGHPGYRRTIELEDDTEYAAEGSPQATAAESLERSLPT